MPKTPLLTRRETLVLGASLAVVAAGPAPAETAPDGLRLSGAVPSPGPIGDAAWRQLPRARVEAASREGKSSVYEGVYLYDVLSCRGRVVPAKPKNAGVAYIVVAKASDGYQVAFAYAEVDPEFTATPVLVADTMGGKPLDAAKGRLRLIVKGDLKPARWLQGVAELNVQKL